MPDDRDDYRAINAIVESFFPALKPNAFDGQPSQVADTPADIIRYIEFWYNMRRLRSGLGYKSSRQVLDEWTNNQEVA